MYRKTTKLSEQEWADIIELGHRKFGTKEWIYGSNLAHYYVDSYFHGIGSIGIAFNVKEHRLADVKIYGDLMVISQKVAEQLQSTGFTKIEQQTINSISTDMLFAYK